MIKECLFYEEQFAELLEGGLSWGERISMQRHVEECAYCRQELLAMKRHWDAVEMMNAVQFKNRAAKNPGRRFSGWIKRFLKIIWPLA